MNKYRVHAYREMRVVFNVEAESIEQAAILGADMPAEYSVEAPEDCDSKTLSCLVDVVGDEEYERSEMVDFYELMPTGVFREMLAALKTITNMEVNSNSEPEAMAAALAQIQTLALAAINKAEGNQP